MDAQLKKVWVEALRSGEYKQGKGMLYRPEETHCCLGVLCKVAGKGSYSEGLSDEQSIVQIDSVL